MKRDLRLILRVAERLVAANGPDAAYWRKRVTVIKGKIDGKTSKAAPAKARKKKPAGSGGSVRGRGRRTSA